MSVIKEAKVSRSLQPRNIIIVIVIVIIILHDKQKNTTNMNLTLSLKISVRTGAASEKTDNYDPSPI